MLHFLLHNNDYVIYTLPHNNDYVVCHTVCRKCGMVIFLVFAEFAERNRLYMYLRFKRFADVLISFVALIVLSPLLAAVSLMIKVESPGSVVFRQRRIGLNGKEFEIYKFRSMCVGAEKMGDGQYCYKGDSRVTRVGKIIRKLSIDELPQLVNIIKGDMSLIGPRPVLTYHPWRISEYTQEQMKRFEVRPGVTGLAQINGRKHLDWNDRIKFDVYYTENISFLLDIKIFFKTIVKIVCAADNENTGKTVGKLTKSKVSDNVEFNVHNK